MEIFNFKRERCSSYAQNEYYFGVLFNFVRRILPNGRKTNVSIQLDDRIQV